MHHFLWLLKMGLVIWLFLAGIKTVLVWFQLPAIVRIFCSVGNSRVKTHHWITIFLAVPIICLILFPMLLLDEGLRFFAPYAQEEIMGRYQFLFPPKE